MSGGGDVALTFDDVARMALELPDVTEGDRRGSRTWFVHGKAFAWERPLNKADIKRFGAVVPPAGLILAAAVADLADKEAVLAANPTALFTIPHFDGYAAILVQLERADRSVLDDVIVDGWLARAPRALAAQFLNRRPG